MIDKGDDWYDCEVNAAGPACITSQVHYINVYLRHVNTEKIIWYIADPSIEREILSVALTALVNKKRCLAYILKDEQISTESKVIKKFYIKY